MNEAVGQFETSGLDSEQARPRAIVLIAAVLWIATLGVALATLWTGLATDAIQIVSAGNDQPIFHLILAMFAAVSIGYATVGLLLVGRPGASRIGLVLVSGGFLFGLVFFGFLLGIRLTLEDPHSPIFSTILLLGPVAIGPGYTLILPAVAIAFPDGGLPSPRWRRPVGIVATLVGLGTILAIIHPGAILGGPTDVTRNPFGVDLLPQGIESLAGFLVDVGIVAATVLGIAAVIVRYRRGDALERQQQRWFLAAVTVAALPFILSLSPLDFGPTMAAIAAAALLLVPISVGIAVTRYRLYEIDHLINRTLVYVPLTALLAGLYAATVALLQRVFQSVTGDKSDAAIIISTLILASVFTPVRKWLEGIVERRFNTTASGIAAAAAEIRSAGSPQWEAEMAAIALRVVRTELEARAVPEPPAA